MKYIRYVSDIHLDWDETWLPPRMEGDEDTLLIIAGDLWKDSKHLTKQIAEWDCSWMEKVAKEFKYVLYVHGNHDYWNARLDTLFEKNKELAQNLDNVYVLENSAMTLDGIRFVGGTLWTDYGNRSQISMMEAVQYMNDYRLTRIGGDYHKMKPTDCLKIFDATKNTIFKEAKECKEANIPCIVVTHMTPSCQSVHEKYRNPSDAIANTWYYSELSNYIVDSGIKYWFCGHVHHAHEYSIGETVIKCNPKGYTGEYTGFDDSARIVL